MSTTLERPEVFDPPDRRRRSRRWRVAVTAVALLALLLVGAAARTVLSASSYQPLIIGGAGTSPFPGTTEDERGEDVLDYPYTYGEPMHFGARLSNNGEDSIAVVGVSAPLEGFLETVAIEIGPAKEMGAPSYEQTRRQPFAPFTLEPGESRMVWTTSLITNCGRTAGSLGTRSLSVRTRHWWFEKDVALRLPFRLQLTSPDSGDDRGADGVCPELRGMDGAAYSASVTLHMPANIRLVLPSHRAWITNEDGRPLRDCRARMETTSGRAYSATVGDIPGRRGRQIPATEFVDDNVSWDPVVHPPADLELTCTYEGERTYQHMPFVAEQADDDDGLDR